MGSVLIKSQIIGLLVFILVKPGVTSLNFNEAENSNRSRSVADFGAIPNDNQNDAVALRKAMAYCKEHPNTVLQFDPGVYDFRDERAYDLMNGILNGKIKGNPQDSIFKPYYPYGKGLDFSGVKNVIVEATGATLLFDGWGEPVSLSNSENIRIKGLTIDHKVKPHIEGEITDVQPNYYEVKVDSIYKLTKEMPLCRIHYYDTRGHHFSSREDFFPQFDLLEENKLRIHKSIDSSMNGFRILSPHTFHFRPAILMLESKNITLENVTIHSQPGMGIVGHRSENIEMNGLRIVPSAGQQMSTNTDATHFTSCKGYIRYINCQFSGHGDDAVNIHNYYMTIEKPIHKKGYNLVLKGADWHAQVLDYPDVADTLELINKQTLEVVKKVVVKTVENNISELYTHITLNEELPVGIENYYLINTTRLPSVEIIGCSVMANRARGFLIKTRNVLIENNLIRESTGTGIHVGAEGSWHEGPASENVIIRYNRILRCGYGAGSVGASGIAINVGAPDETVSGLHKNILIEGNVIEGENAENGILISNASGVAIRYNDISGCKTPVKIKHSEVLNVHDNLGFPNLREKRIE